MARPIVAGTLHRRAQTDALIGHDINRFNRNDWHRLADNPSPGPQRLQLGEQRCQQGSVAVPPTH